MSTPRTQPQTSVVNSIDVPPPGWVRMKSSAPTLNIVGPLGPEAPHISGGFGGYEIVSRPRQVGMTIWNGTEPYQLTFSMFLEGFKEGKSVEEDIGAVMRCAHGTDGEPGTVQVFGIPRLPATDWVIEGLDFDQDTTIRNMRMERIRQKMTWTLREEVNPVYLPLRAEALMGKKPAYTTVKVRHNDTPAKLAKKYKLSSWFILRQLNPGVITKAEQKLKDGSKIRVPFDKVKSSYR
jgi:hypothetical protein